MDNAVESEHPSEQPTASHAKPGLQVEGEDEQELLQAVAELLHKRVIAGLTWTDLIDAVAGMAPSGEIARSIAQQLSAAAAVARRVGL